MRATEIGVGAVVVLADRDFFGPELRVARRTTGQGRLSFVPLTEAQWRRVHELAAL